MQDYTATYSPEDNKLRLYAVSRLPKDLYDQAKAAGFKWAPKQELFVAPMWTPSREDFLLSLVDEIEDEDTSLVDRAEQRADRFEDYSDNRKQDADRAHAAVSAIADGIPFGQPILVGHHSERHARRDAKRIENGMRRAVKMWEQSEYWIDRAKGAIRHAKYKELPAVRARRIKGLEADKRKQERVLAEHERCLLFWNGRIKRKEEAGGGFIEVSWKSAKWFTNIFDHTSACFPLADYPRKPGASNYEGSTSFWSALGDTEETGIITAEQARDLALPHHLHYGERAERWIAHYENRLAYERAMLGESGGIVTDRKGPEKGGGVRCWASHRGGWSYIVKVNRVSVSVLDNWGNSTDADGSRNFKRTIPFDKLNAVMTAAEVQEARAEGRLIEYGDKTGFVLSDASAPPPTPKAEPEPETNNLTGKDFDAMKETLKAGVQVVSAPQLFPTPRELADRMIEELDIQPGDRILEPSAGTGRLVGAMGGCMFEEPGTVPYRDRDQLYAVEINSSLAGALERDFPLTKVICGDFLEQNGNLGTFDRIVMNPPFVNGADIKHIQHALNFLKPGGRLVALCADGPRQRHVFNHSPNVASYEPLPAGSFSEQGTNVSVALLVINAPEETRPRESLFD